MQFITPLIRNLINQSFVKGKKDNASIQKKIC